MLARFAWDVKKAAANQRKHRVSFTEASEVFLDPLAVSVPDHRHEADELRFFTLGETRAGRLLAVGHTDSQHEIRIITARWATTAERRHYEQGS